MEGVHSDAKGCLLCAGWGGRTLLGIGLLEILEVGGGREIKVVLLGATSHLELHSC